MTKKILVFTLFCVSAISNNLYASASKCGKIAEVIHAGPADLETHRSTSIKFVDGTMVHIYGDQVKNMAVQALAANLNFCISLPDSSNEDHLIKVSISR